MQTRGFEIVHQATGEELMRAAQKWVNVSSVHCHVFVRTKDGVPESVVIRTGSGAIPDERSWGYAYVSASQFGLHRTYEQPTHLKR